MNEIAINLLKDSEGSLLIWL